MKNTLLAIALLVCIAAGGCASQPKRPLAAIAPARALTACEQSKDLPPTQIGAARSGTGQQPVLIVQDSCPEGGG